MKILDPILILLAAFLVYDISLLASLFVLLAGMAFVFRDGLRSRISSGGINIGSGRINRSSILFLLLILLVFFIAVYALYLIGHGIGTEAGVIHSDLPSCNPENIKVIEGGLVFTEYKDGRFGDLSAEEKAKYSVWINPKEDIIKIFGGTKAIVYLEEYKIPTKENGFTIKGEVIDGVASVNFNLERTSEDPFWGVYSDAINIPYTFAGRETLNIDLREGYIMISSSKKVDYSPPIEVTQGIFGVNANFNVPSGQTLTVSKLRVRQY